MESIGPYRLVDKIGEGGMGEVWLAEQEQPIRRTVAIKIIKLGMDTREFVSRFEMERQALALMSHPGVARIFDAGSTPQGRPFLVMEYVPGEGIVDFCNRARLNISDRLRLFVDVCNAVQHAHHKAIIHRDLKPSNVLVAVEDGVWTPKIIDFGIARSITHAVDQTMLTLHGNVIGTPEYMSPEQANVTGEDVDTRADVYSLSAILYELLTDTTPLELRGTTAADSMEIWRRIRDDDPPTPSGRVRSLGTQADEVATHRRTSVASLLRDLSGDLDAITLKALEKDRSRRYGSPSELAADIQRHLANETVSARAPSTVYKVGRFVKRHRAGVTAAVAAVVVLIGFSIAMVGLAARVARERDNAYQQAQAKQQVADFLKGLFEVSDPSRARGTSVTAREILDAGVRKIDQTLDNQPEVRADLLGTLGEVYDSLGLYGEAERITKQALDLQNKIRGSDHPTTIDTLSQLGYLSMHQGRLDEAEALLKEVLDRNTQVFGPDHNRTLAQWLDSG